MATLTDEDYTELRRTIYRPGMGKEELKTLPYLPNKIQLRAGFQAIEDGYEAVRAGMKSDLDAALEQTTSIELAQKFEVAWAKWRFE
jgi:hypothetical protein